MESHLGLKTIDQFKDEPEDEDDFELNPLRPGIDANYTSNKSRRGNTTDRKSQAMRPSQSVLNMLVQKDKILAD